MRCLRVILLAAIVALPCRYASGELIAHFEFDGDATDSVGEFFVDGEAFGDAEPSGEGTGFDGTGDAYRFGGEGNIVVPLDINPIEFPDLTVSMWIKPDQQVVDSPGLYKTLGHDDGGWDRTFGLDTRVPDGVYRYAAFTGGAGPGPTEDTGSPITTEWTFMAVSWETDLSDDTLGTVTTYVSDGGTLNTVSQDLFNTTGFAEFAIGSLRPDNFDEGFVGLIDEVRIYDEILSADDIFDLGPGQFIINLAGDANNDGTVDIEDYQLMQANMFSADPQGAPLLGDVNQDQVVDFADFRVWKEAFPGGAAAAEAAIASIPEPSSLTLSMGLLGLFSVIRRRRDGV